MQSKRGKLQQSQKCFQITKRAARLNKCNRSLSHKTMVSTQSRSLKQFRHHNYIEHISVKYYLWWRNKNQGHWKRWHCDDTELIPLDFFLYNRKPCTA